jgi:hypothetical protein
MEYNVVVSIKKTNVKQIIKYDLNTEKMIQKIKKVYNTMSKEYEKSDIKLELNYIDKSNRDITEIFANVTQLIYRIKII